MGLHFSRTFIGAISELDVFRNIYQNRAGATSRGHVKSSVQGRGQFIWVFHQPIVLGAGPGNAHGISFLEGV